MAMSRRAKRRFLALVSLIVIVGVAAAGFKAFRARQQERLVEEARVRGVEAYERGDLENALKQLSYYLQYNYDNPAAVDLILMFADARSRVPLAEGRHRPEAMEYFERARRLLDIHPELPDREARIAGTRRRLLDLYFDLGLRAELLQNVESMLETDPNDVAALSARARALAADLDSRQSLQSAFEDVQRLVVLEPEDPAWRYLQLQVMRSLDWPEGEQIAQCDAWIDQWSGDGRMYLMKAGWLAETGRLEGARAAAAAAAQRGADTLDVLQRLVSLLDLLEMRQEAAAVLARARSRFPEEQWVPEATVRRLWHAGQIEEALVEIDRARAEHEALDSGLRRLQVALLISAGRSDDARAALTALADTVGEGERGRIDRAWITALNARLDLDRISWREAIEAYQQAILLDPRDALLSFLLGEAYASVGERSLAIDAYDHAFKTEPSWLAAGAALAEALLAGGRPHDAFERARVVLHRATDKSVSYYLLLARSYLESLRAGGEPVITDAATGRAIDITTMLTSLNEQIPDLPMVPALLTEAHCLHGRVEQAKRAAAEAAAESEDAGTLLAVAAVSQRYALGLEGDLLARARELDWPSIPVAAALADHHARQGRFDEGLALIDEAIASATLDEREASSVRRARVAYLLRMGHPEALRELAVLIDDLSDSIETQTFAVARPEAWEDRAVVRSTIDNLAALLGESAPQVRLAEANFLLRFKGRDEAERAQAIMMIAEVLEQSPSSLPGLILMAQASLIGDPPAIDRAVTHLARAVDVAPGRAELYVQLIDLHQRQGNHEEAGRRLHELSRLAERDRDMLRSELKLLRVQGDFEEALLRAGELVDERSSVADQLLLAALHQRAGEMDEAEAVFGRLLQAPGADEFVIVQAAEFYADTDRLEHAAELLERLEPDGGPAERALILGAFFRRHDRPAEAREWLTRALEEDSQSAEAHHQLARLALERSDLPAAQEFAVAGLRIDPEHAGLRGTLATVNLSLNPSERSQAIELLRELGAEDDALLATLVLLESVPVIGGASSPDQDQLAAARSLTKTHPQFLPAWYLAIALHREAGREREAIDLARSAVSRFRSVAEPSQWATQLLMHYRRWDEAFVEAQEWRRRAPGDRAAVDIVLAQILLELGRSGDAAAQLAPYADRFIAERDVDDDPPALWIRALLLDGDQERAWETIRPLLDEDPKWSVLWMALAGIVDYQRAYTMLTVIEPTIDRFGPEGAIRLARAWAALGWRFEEPDGFDRAEALIRTVPDDPRWRVGSLSVAGRIAEGRGDLAGAERAYRAVLQLQPVNAAALNNLAFVLAQTPDRAAEALEYAQQALARQPDHPDLMDTYGRALLCSGQAGEACEVLDRALAARPDDVGICLSLAEARLAASALNDAAAMLSRARRTYEALTVPQPALGRKIEAVEQRLREARAAAGA